MKVITYYLPQFHEIPENNNWWGKGFTEWTNVKKAMPLYKDHYQPRVPLNDNYYRLLDDSVQEWQVKLAKEHGIYGFCFYHYWFDGHLLLEKPIEQFLDRKALDLKFCLSWANEHWTNAWAGRTEEVLISQTYGDQEEWARHMDYLLPFFLDERYIRIDGRPLFIIYRPEIIPCLNDMLDYMVVYAKENNLPGLAFAFQHVHYDLLDNPDKSRFELNIEYQPSYALIADEPLDEKERRLKQQHRKEVLDRLPFAHNLMKIRTKIRSVLLDSSKRVKIYNYEEIWQRVLDRTPKDNICVPGAFVDWDNTPRKGDWGCVFSGASPEKFKRYLKKQIVRARTVYDKDMLFLFAWNEWAEGGYLEPDEKYGHGYLEALKEALVETNEFPTVEEADE